MKCRASLVSAIIISAVCSAQAQDAKTTIITNFVDVGQRAYVCGDKDSGNTVIVTNGGTIASQTGYIGKKAGANSNTVIIVGTGSKWNDATGFDIGDRSSYNNLTLLDGGKLNCTAAYLGYYPGAAGNSVKVSGNGAMLNVAEGLHIGNGGSGSSVVVENGGAVYCGEGTTVGPGPDSSLTVSGSKSMVNVSGGDIVVGGAPGSRLTVQDGGLVDGSVVVQAGSTAGGAGTIGSLALKPGATLSPGDPVGKLTIAKGLTLDGGAKVAFDLGGAKTAGTDYDLVEVKGALVMTNNVEFGSFVFTDKDGFGPGTYTLFTADSFAGNLGASLSGKVKDCSAALSKGVDGKSLVLTVTK